MSDKPSILVADDQPITRTLISDMLQQEYTIHEAIDGQEALNIIFTEKIDLVLLDVVMPKKNGFEVLNTIKQSHASRDIPVIMLTILDQEENEEHGFALGVADFITKPVNRSKLITRVQNQLELKRQRDLLHEKNEELQKALSQIKTLQGIIPICSFCKQIRDDAGYWQQVEAYVELHSDAAFSHSICPDCLKKHY